MTAQRACVNVVDADRQYALRDAVRSTNRIRDLRSTGSFDDHCGSTDARFETMIGFITMRRTSRLRHPRSERGFTLVELVAVLVILGSVAAIALQTYADLRASSRRTAINGIAAAMRANMTSARAAYIVQPGATVVVAGRTIAVYGEGSGATPGLPTVAGLWTAMDCGPPPSSDGPATCTSLPNMQSDVYASANLITFAFGTACYVRYQPLSHGGFPMQIGNFTWDGQGTLTSFATSGAGSC